MKKFENLGKSLSKEEQKKIGGGDAPTEGCLAIGAYCNENVQCCSSNRCDYISGGGSYKVCYA